MSGLTPFRIDDQAQVIRLLTDIKSSLQRIEQEVRDCRVRLGHSVLPVRSTGPNATMQELPPVRESNHSPMSIHTPKGTIASNRVKSLRARLEVGQEEMGKRLGVSGQMVGSIESGHSGISMRVHQALEKIESGR